MYFDVHNHQNLHLKKNSKTHRLYFSSNLLVMNKNLKHDV
jgi:hypothetical protein